MINKSKKKKDSVSQYHVKGSENLKARIIKMIHTRKTMINQTSVTIQGRFNTNELKKFTEKSSRKKRKHNFSRDSDTDDSCISHKKSRNSARETAVKLTKKRNVKVINKEKKQERFRF